MGWWIPRLKREHMTAVAARVGEVPRTEQRRLLVRVRRAAFCDRRVYIPGGVVVALLAVGFGLMLHQPARPPLTELIVAMVAYIGSLVAAVCCVITSERLVQRSLAAEFPMLCPACGYDRRATPARCPECGTESPAPP